jgi:hypothetical protein
MIKRITVSLPHDLLAGAKRKAAAENRTLTSVIEEGLRLVLAEGRKRRHYPLRLSTATGPPLPGIDIYPIPPPFRKWRISNTSSA